MGTFRPLNNALYNNNPIEPYIIYVVPGFDFSFLERLTDYSALIFVLYGCGSAPNRKERFIEVVKRLSTNCLLVACSQCASGTVNLEKYGVGLSMKNAGLISVSDMTVEATITKLYYLFSREKSAEEVAKALVQNARGEISHDA